MLLGLWLSLISLLSGLLILGICGRNIVPSKQLDFPSSNISGYLMHFLSRNPKKNEKSTPPKRFLTFQDMELSWPEKS